MAGTLLATLALVAAIRATPVAGQAPRSTNDGVYADSQAVRGQQLFEANCTACHDTGRFKGPEFVSAWTKQPIASLFEMMSGTMPADNPGGLKPRDYADVIAFVLKGLGAPAGADDLPSTAEALKPITFDPPK